MSALETFGAIGDSQAAIASSYDFSHDCAASPRTRSYRVRENGLVHRQIAQALQAAHDPTPRCRRQSSSRQPGRRHDLAATSAIAAGNRCLRLFAYSEGIAVAARAADRGTLPDDVRIGIQLELLHIIVLTRTRIKTAALEAAHRSHPQQRERAT